MLLGLPNDNQYFSVILSQVTAESDRMGGRKEREIEIREITRTQTFPEGKQFHFNNNFLCFLTNLHFIE